MKFRSLISLVLAGLVVVFTAQNIQTVHVYFLLWEISMPRALMIFTVFLLGVVAGALLRPHRKR